MFYLFQKTGDVEFKVFFVAPEDDSEIDEANSVVDGTYPFLEEQDTVSIKSKSMTNEKQQKTATANNSNNKEASSSSSANSNTNSSTVVEVKTKTNSVSSSYDTQSIASASNDPNNADKRSMIGKLDKISKALESKQ